MNKLEEHFYTTSDSEQINNLHLTNTLLRKQFLPPITFYNGYHILPSTCRYTILSQEHILHTDHSVFSLTQQPLFNNSYASPQILNTLLNSIHLPLQIKSNLPFFNRIPSLSFNFLTASFLSLNQIERAHVHTILSSVTAMLANYLFKKKDVKTRVNVKKQPPKSKESNVKPIQLLMGSGVKDYEEMVEFLQTIICASQVKRIMICWYNQQTFPLDPQHYRKNYEVYLDKVYWKIMRTKQEEGGKARNKAMTLATPDQKMAAEREAIKNSVKTGLEELEEDAKENENNDKKALDSVGGASKGSMEQYNHAKAEVILYSKHFMINTFHRLLL
jgi:hypothetical protein